MSKFDMAHYCLDIENNVVLKNISRNLNYDVLLYIAHDNHMYFINDKKFIRQINHKSRLGKDDIETKIIFKMVQENEHKKMKSHVQSMKISRLNKINDYKDCMIIYQKNDLTNIMITLYKQNDKRLSKTTTRNKKVIKITIKDTCYIGN
jgi:hypothetical protein